MAMSSIEVEGKEGIPQLALGAIPKKHKDRRNIFSPSGIVDSSILDDEVYRSLLSPEVIESLEAYNARKVKERICGEA
jgi:hypothetical protein